MKENFISDQIKPLAGTFDTIGIAKGEPRLPKRFIWINTEYTVDSVLKKWKEVSPCKSGGKERYVRKHWFLIKTTDGCVMKIYFERTAKSRTNWKLRWWLYSITDSNSLSIRSRRNA
ncbi:hypothetical protein AMJ52_03450 [candidate division TA06 bacterium DG_78]|uniref:DUF6504 domain-containing protein n=1 Tax=candidate division TA06 bacterium DG_78 TaxID=1703772 RepID=A0A0S7YFP0_UNCT6|nr:MAG: hypothetical protein AMJ52_03450 [candidate division TA06 bacterium DG_78]